jgi:hypothetical protein
MEADIGLHMALHERSAPRLHADDPVGESTGENDMSALNMASKLGVTTASNHPAFVKAVGIAGHLATDPTGFVRGAGMAAPTATRFFEASEQLQGAIHSMGQADLARKIGTALTAFQKATPDATWEQAGNFARQTGADALIGLRVITGR